MRVLITGGAGFIGSNLAKYLLDKGYEVVILDNLYSGFMKNIKDLDVEFIRGDIRYAPPLLDACKRVDTICHLAAISVVPASFMNPRETFDINLYGTLNVLETAVKANVRKVIFPSSASVYGKGSKEPVRENQVGVPLSPYAITKLGMEHLLKMFAREHGLDTCSLRLFNVYGPNQDPDSGVAIPNFMAKALANQPITIHGDGSQTRDYIYVEDIARAFEAAMKTRTNGDVFNIAQGRSISILDVAKKIKEKAKSSSVITTTSRRIGDVDHSLASVEKAKEKLGFSTQVRLDEGLKRAIAGLSLS